MREAGGAILAWIIQGAKMFIEAGCHIDLPDAVKAATQRYKDQEDWLQGFIDDCCIVDTEADNRKRWISVGKLYTAYKDYADSTGAYRRCMGDFNRAMENAGFRKIGVHGSKKRWLAITTQEDDNFVTKEEQTEMHSG